MWHNYSEDWERKKCYLNRSLFQDIPILSPVAEESGSIPVSPRPHSPLPPLIIERIPNRHDHPDSFYDDLEIKAKEAYRALFLDGKVSIFVKDWINKYIGFDDISYTRRSSDDITYPIDVNGCKDFNIPTIIEHCVTVNNEDLSESTDDPEEIKSRVSHDDSLARCTVDHINYPMNVNFDKTYNVPTIIEPCNRIDDEFQSESMEDREESQPEVSHDDSHSHRCLGYINNPIGVNGSKIYNIPTIMEPGVVVGNEDSESIEESQSKVSLDISSKSSSPILVPKFVKLKEKKNDKRADPEKTFEVENSGVVVGNEDSESIEELDESQSKVSLDISSKRSSPILVPKFVKLKEKKNDKRGEPEKTFEVKNSGDSITADDSEECEENRFEDIFYWKSNYFPSLEEGIEIMRRQQRPSPSLGSLQDYIDQSINKDEACLTRSTPLQLQMSQDYNDIANEINFEGIQDVRQELDKKITNNFSNIDFEVNQRKRSMSQDLGRLESDEDESEANVIVETANRPIKRRKYEHIAVQTSPGLENEKFCWDNIKYNFFVGVPRIYKLCACKNHKCRVDTEDDT